MTESTRQGNLYLVSTPIGNLEDITLRALRILKEVDLIAAEDTRRTRHLLTHFDINGKLESYHDHNKERKTPRLLSALQEGRSAAVVSDAGTPGISDPAFYLAREAIRESIPVVPIPGPTAAIAGLTVSGLPTNRFVFEGFLPPKKGRKKRLAGLSDEKRTIILYESPHRLLRTLTDLSETLGSRMMAVGRELTKQFEEVVRGTIEEVLLHFSESTIRGEFVLIIHGKTKDNHEKT